jgi:hypothetical protein
VKHSTVAICPYCFQEQNRRGINDRKGDRYPLALPINTRAVKAALLCAGTYLLRLSILSVPAHRRKRDERINPSTLSSSRPLRLLMNLEMNLLLPLSQLAPLLGDTELERIHLSRLTFCLADSAAKPEGLIYWSNGCFCL